MSYTKAFTPQYEDGWQDRPDTSTPVIADALNGYDEALEHIEDYLYSNPIPSTIPGGNYVLKDGDTMTGDLIIKGASSYPSLIIGTKKGTTSLGGADLLVGTNLTGFGSFSAVFGENSSALGRDSFAGGYGAKAGGNQTIAYGDSCEAGANCSAAFGNGTLTGTQSQFAVGKFNNSTPGNLFEVGNGTSKTSRSNAFEVDSSGNATAAGNVADGNGTTIAYLLSLIQALDQRVSALET